MVFIEKLLNQKKEDLIAFAPKEITVCKAILMNKNDSSKDTKYAIMKFNFDNREVIIALSSELRDSLIQMLEDIGSLEPNN